MENKETEIMSSRITDLAKIFYASGIFTDIKSEAQAMVKILAGQEMGLSPIESMNVVYIVGNKIGVETKVFLSRIKNSGTYDYSVEYEYGNNRLACSATVTFYRIEKGERIEIGTSTYSDDDAAKSSLKNKQSYTSNRELMLFYRAASKGIKLFCPQFLSGIGVYEEYDSLTSPIKELTLNKDGVKIQEIGALYGEKEKETI
jgi:hypothetical protein